MKKLVIVRHGVYSDDDCLTDFGKWQIKSLAQKILEHTAEGKVVLLSSTADRARQSAEIIGSILGVEHQLHEILWSDCDHAEDYNKVLDLIRSRKEVFDFIILVTHLEYGERFPSHFGKHELEETRLNGYGIEKGQAWIIDCQTKQMTKLKP